MRISYHWTNCKVKNDVGQRKNHWTNRFLYAIKNQPLSEVDDIHMCKGYIYVIGSYEHLTHVKVGLSKKQPHLRLSELQTGNPFHLQLWGSYSVNRGSLLECEQIIHKNLKEYHFRNEWFVRHPKDMVTHVEMMVNKYNKLK